MEPAAAWIPFDIQLSNWTMEYAGWAPGYPVELESTETFGNSWLQTSSGGRMVEYAAATDDDSIDKAAQEFEAYFHNMGMKIPINPIHVFEDAAREFKVDIDMMKMKIHMYPPSIQVFDDKFFTIPRLVAIGPYHHGQNQLKQAEKAKCVAAYHCIMESGHSVQDMYDAVVSAAYDARSLYDKDVMAGISEEDFLHMMFYDACFLVQYFACSTDGSGTMDPSLRGFFDFNRKAIRHDIVLLENQIPWRVVEAVLRFRPVDLEAFVAFWKQYLQDRKVLGEQPLVLDDSFEPPHLLGLLRFYIVGKGNTKPPTQVKTNMISFSVSAIELAENGIKLKANEETTELIHMGVNKRGIFAELSMAPLSLDDERASFLINMAALELCTTSNFQEAEPEDSAVCSYLLLLSLLVHREEDVQELRTKHLLQGGAGLINKDALTFFTRLQSLPLRGSNCYVRIMMEIEKYKLKRQMQIKVYAFFYKNKRTIFAIFSVVGVLVSILGTLMSLKKQSMV
ncbi:hypothetical protein ACQ4PT_017822 [Festuca glaucescens]